MYRKLVVIGDVGAGKSTIIRTLSEIETVDTDVLSSEDIGKPLTTVGIDYGRITFDEGEAIGLYGVPGQSRYSFIWDMVKDDIWGCVLLLRSDALPEQDKLFQLLDVFVENNKGAPLVVGVTHTDNAPFEEQSIRDTLKSRGLNPPLFSIDARKKEGALLLLHTLMSIHSANDFLNG